MDGSDRDAGCACNFGMSKNDIVAIPPDAMSEIAMLKSCTALNVEDIFTED